MVVEKTIPVISTKHEELETVATEAKITMKNEL